MPTEGKKRKKLVVVEENAANEEVNAQPEVVEDKLAEHEQPAAEPKAEQDTSVVPQPVPMKEPHQFNLFFFFLILFFVVVVTIFAGGLYVYFTGVSKDQVAVTSEPSVEPSASPDGNTASPTPAATAASYKISILNGSGKAGEAGRAKALVEKAGFQVESTGNASTFNFTDTQVQVKSTLPAEVATKIKDSLRANYSIVDGKALDTKSQFDIVITVGSKAP